MMGEYYKIFLKTQMWVDAEDSLEVWQNEYIGNICHKGDTL